MEETVAIGKVINTHGVKGGLKIHPLSDYPERVKLLRQVFLEKNDNSTSYKVTDAFMNGRFWVVILDGIDSCDDAEKLIGSMLTIPLSERVVLPDDAYFLDQIIGIDVYTVDGSYLGSVTDVLQTGSNDVYVVKNESGDGREVLIPALKAVVVAINLEEQRMDVDPPEGLL